MSDESTSARPRLPQGPGTFAELVADSIDTIAERSTPYATSARLFGERYGFLLALSDALSQSEGRESPVQRMMESASGLVARAKGALQSSWDERAGSKGLDGTLGSVAKFFIRRIPAAASSFSGDVFAGMGAKIDAIDQHPDHAKAAVEFAELWMQLRRLHVVLTEAKEEAPEHVRTDLHDVIRSLGRWQLELEQAWATRCFDELLGEPTIGELLQLIFPDIVFRGPGGLTRATRGLGHRSARTRNEEWS